MPIPIPKGVGRSLAHAVQELVEGLTSKATPELAERMAKPNAQFERGLAMKPAAGSVEHGVGLRGETSPIADESMRRAVRTTEVAIEPSGAERTRSVTARIKGLAQRAPELPEDLRQAEIEMATWRNTAKSKAEIDIKHRVLDLLEDDGPLRKQHKAQMLSDYVVALDEVANLVRTVAKTGGNKNTTVGLGGKTLQQWEDFLTKTGQEVARAPDVAKAVKAYRQITDETFADMVDRGLIIPERKLADYFTNQKIGLIQDTLQQITGEVAKTKIGSIVPPTLKRGGGTGARETNVIRATGEMLEQYYRNVAEGEYAAKVLADPTLNKTAEAIASNEIPITHTAWAPKPGQAGYGVMAPQSQILNGLMQGLGAGSKQYHGGYVIPKEIAYRLDHIRQPTPTQEAELLFNMGNGFSRWMTVYNVANWTINLMSDMPMAMGGLPGERARPLGVLRFALFGPNGELLPAVRAAWAATHGRDFKMKVPFKTAGGATGSQDLNVADLAQLQGLTTAGEAQAFGGMPTSRHFESIGDVEGMGGLGNTARTVKNTIEAYPRIAAGLEAFSRTGSIAEFGRVGRNATLNYGHAAPDWSREPAFRMLAHFTQFIGLASDHYAKMLGTPGSKLRTPAILATPVLALHLWNTHDEEYQQVEDTIQPHERGNLHIIWPGPDGKPARDRTGKPIVVGARWFVGEEVLKFVGLGNLAARAHRVIRGKDTPLDAIMGIPDAAAKNVASQVGVISSAEELLEGRSRLTGDKQSRLKTLVRSVPLAKQADETIKEFRATKDVRDAARVGAEQVGGVRFLAVDRKGRPADMVEWERQLREAKMALDSAKFRQDRVGMEDAITRIREAQANLRRIGGAK